MKFASLAAVLLIAGGAMPAMADGHAEASEASAAFSINTPIEVLLANDDAKAVVFAYLPGLDEHPAYGQFKAMSLVELQPWSQGQVTDEALEGIAAGLAELG